MGFNSAFKGLKVNPKTLPCTCLTATHCVSIWQAAIFR